MMQLYDFEIEHSLFYQLILIRIRRRSATLNEIARQVPKKSWDEPINPSQ